jgi:hypothetical protein
MTIEEMANSMAHPFLGAFDQHMVAAWNHDDEHKDYDNVVKAYAKAMWTLEKVIKDAGSSFEKIYTETRIKLDNGQEI